MAHSRNRDFWSWSHEYYRKLSTLFEYITFAHLCGIALGRHVHCGCLPDLRCIQIDNCIFLRAVVGGCVSLFWTKLYGKWGVGWTFIALAFAPVPSICYRYGEKWRRNANASEGEVGQGKRGSLVVMLTLRTESA
jgi:hypothetical protein